MLILSQCFQAALEKSESDVLHYVYTKLPRIQKQLDHVYHDDVFLRDQILVATDIPEISRALREKVPQSSQEAIQRIATFMSSESHSAGAHFCDKSSTDNALYSLGNRFRGEARKRLKSGTKQVRTNRRLSSKWLAGLKGCWVCGGTHTAKSKHSRE